MTKLGFSGATVSRIKVCLLILIFLCFFIPTVSFSSALYGGDTHYDDRLNIGSHFFADPNPLSGAFTYQVSLTLPPGRNNLKPDLSLKYSSEPGDQVSPFGYGWSISIPYIERIPRKGTDNLYNQDEISSVFFSALDGEVIASSTTVGTEDFGPKTDNGNFRKYEFVDNQWWRVTDKGGFIYKFGQATSTRQNNPNVATSTAKWMLEEVRDANNNYISYDYFKDSGQIYPATTTYTGYGTTPGIYSVEFFLENRNDKATSTVTGFSVASNYRVAEIQVKVDGSWVRKYKLDYTTGDNQIRSLLDVITETGRGEDGTTLTLPAIDFDYQPDHTTASSTWTLNSSYTIPYNFNTGDANGVWLIDVNKDSFPDIIRGASPGNTYINNTSNTGWTDNTGGISVPIQLNLENVRIIDFNADGLPDILSAPNPTQNDPQLWVHDTNGVGWTANSASTTVSYAFSTFAVDHDIDLGAKAMDVNGDGLSDIVKSYATSTFSGEAGVLINKGDGTGWATSTTNYNIPVYFSMNDVNNGVLAVDVNGDGLVDLLQGIDGVKGVYINNGDGTGWTQDDHYEEGLGNFILSGGDNGLRVADVNGDGLVDLIHSRGPGSPTQDVYLNKGNGTGWRQVFDYNIPIYFASGGADKGVQITDVNGDNMPDLVKSFSGDREVYIHQGVVTDILSKVTTSAGGTINVTYTTTGLTTDVGTTTTANPSLPFNFPVSKNIVRDDGFETVATTTYSYGGGEYYYNNEYDRRFATFATTTETDPFGNVSKNYFHQGNGSQSAIGENSDNQSKIGKPYRTEVYDDSSNLYQKSINRWENVSLANDRNFVKLATTTNLSYDGDSDRRDAATESNYDDTNGNLTQQIAYGEVTGNDDGTFADTGTDKRTTDFTYSASSTAYIIGLPQTQTIKDNSGTTVAQNRFYYDNLSLGLIGAGNRTKEERLISGSTYLNIQHTYNSYGLITQDTDPRGKNTNYVYESSNQYLGTTTNPLSQIVETYRDLSSGKITRLTDQNSREFQTTYDALDRVTAEKIPDHLGTPTNLVTKSDYAYTDTVGSRKVLRTDYLSTATSTETYTYLDGFDRIVQTRKEAEGSGTYVVTDTKYNERGDVATTSLPYFSSGSSKTSATTTAALLIQNSHDPLRRIKTIVNAKGTETHAYDQWAETVTDRNSKTKDFTKDAFGNLVQVDEHNSGNTYTTAYTYDVLNNLTKITDSLSNIRNFTYDDISRLLNSEDLHASADTSFASTTYTYDDSGNITSKLDAKNQTVDYTHDDVNRLLTEDYTGNSGTDITYSYDWCSDGKGRLCQATTTDAITTNTYDVLGDLTTENKEIASTTYLTTYTYDRQGNKTQIGYPNGLTVFYNYNGAGLLETIGAQQPGSTPAYIVSNFDYGPTGQVAYKKFGNNIESTYTYDADELYRLQQIDTNPTN